MLFELPVDFVRRGIFKKLQHYKLIAKFSEDGLQNSFLCSPVTDMGRKDLYQKRLRTFLQLQGRMHTVLRTYAAHGTVAKERWAGDMK